MPRYRYSLVAIASLATRKVVPSGADLATASAAMLPPAPGRFSITIGWPSASVSLVGLSGQVCAWAGAKTQAAAAAQAKASLMTLPPVVCLLGDLRDSE